MSAEPTREHVCAVIVTYHPDDRFPDRCRQIARQVGRVVIIDNGSGGETIQRLRTLEAAGTAHLVINPDNRGIAVALNQGVTWARAHGFAWALLFDHDTVPEDGIVNELRQIYIAFHDKQRLAVIGSNFRRAGDGKLQINFPEPLDAPWVQVKTVITSGSLISLSAAAEIGPFREEFFIDHVDDEYCLRARSKGYEVLLACDPLTTHAIGYPTLHRVLWRTWGTSNYSASRRYYMTRNHFVLIKEYGSRELAWATTTFYWRLKSLILLILLERERGVKLRHMGKGLWDGFRGRLGEL